LNDVISVVAIATVGFGLSVSLHPGLNGDRVSLNTQKLSDVTNQLSVLTK